MGDKRLEKFYYVGIVESTVDDKETVGFVRRKMEICDHSSEELIINHVEEAQLRNALRREIRENTVVHIAMSKHGLKIIDATDGSVLDRVPLLSVVQSVSFDDGFGNTNVVFVVQKALSTTKQCYIFRAQSPHDADHICAQLQGEVFGRAKTKSPRRNEFKRGCMKIVQDGWEQS
ncbi:hypothetical protein AB6A40_008710 [Gnathostoma spinigerum]|uniref:PID domain-containing protein n=1 Tax=Gnathostoma spinigerum TaxID=75299 RepID=A0ABD6EWY0_9BILA